MKCNKVKNPCKICFEAVTKKNGLQCQGACRKWAHFKCLNYTPGKIQDIKAGIIKITCPCPDCNTFEPKEVLADPPYTCTNTKCPANKLPVCESLECPGKDSPIPIYPPPPLDYSSDSMQDCSPCPPPCPPPCQTPSPKQCPTPPRCNPPRNRRGCCTSQQDSPRSPPKSPPKCPAPTPKCEIPTPKTTRPRSPPCPNPLRCPPPCKPVCPPSCPSYQNVKKGKKCCSPKQSQSCSNVSKNSNGSANSQSEQLRAISSESQIQNSGNGDDQKLLYSAIENLCNTVGQLSTQLKELMCKMQETPK